MAGGKEAEKEGRHVWQRGEMAGCSGFGKLSNDRQSPARGDPGRQRRSRVVHHL